VRRRFYIPDPVGDAIRDHFQTAIERSRQEFFSAAEDEDALTGHLGARLEVPTQRVDVPDSEVSGPWKWSVRYTKFRGRGRDAPERFLGADGILELSVEMGRTDMKTLLFQSKVGDGSGGRDLVAQALKLSTWREAAAVFAYSPDGYLAYTLDDVLEHRGQLRNAESVPLHEFLGGPFLGCVVGDDDLRYDARRRRLAWRAMNGEVVSATFRPSHRFAVKVEAPKQLGRDRIDRELSPEDVHAYRMLATPEEILRRAGTRAVPPLQKAQREMLKLYHPDLYNDLDDLLQELATKRSQDVGQAFDRVTKRGQRRL
jgi:hypothetical protein